MARPGRGQRESLAFCPDHTSGRLQLPCYVGRAYSHSLTAVAWLWCASA